MAIRHIGGRHERNWSFLSLDLSSLTFKSIFPALLRRRSPPWVRHCRQPVAGIKHTVLSVQGAAVKPIDLRVGEDEAEDASDRTCQEATYVSTAQRIRLHEHVLETNLHIHIINQSTSLTHTLIGASTAA